MANIDLVIWAPVYDVLAGDLADDLRRVAIGVRLAVLDQDLLDREHVERAPAVPSGMSTAALTVSSSVGGG